MTKCTVPPTEQLTSEPAAAGEPPMKKQKVEGGAAVVTASANITESSTENLVAKTSGRSRKRKRSKRKIKFQNPCHEMPQFKNGDFHNLLWMYFDEKDAGKNQYPDYNTINDPELKLPGVTSFLTTCKLAGLIGKGRGKTKKKSKQQSCLAIIQKLGLVPMEKFVDTLAFTIKKSGNAQTKSKKPAKLIIEYASYLQGNFKGTLEAYLRKNNPENRIILKFELVKNDKEPGVLDFITSCSTVKGDHIGIGCHKIKKKSIQLACLECMLKMKLLTKEEHLQKHPAEIPIDKVVKENQEAGESSKLQKTPNVKEDVTVEKQDVGESAKMKPEADSMEKVTVVKQDGGPSKKLEETEVAKEA